MSIHLKFMMYPTALILSEQNNKYYVTQTVSHLSNVRPPLSSI
jgi:hypothetical protein